MRVMRELRSVVVRLAAVALVASLAGCGTSLIVRHEDPRNPVAVIWLDGKQTSTVGYGKSVSLDVRRGAHRLRASLPGKKQNTPWHPEEQELNLVIDEDATLTLLPRDPR